MRTRITVEGKTSPSGQFIEEGALVFPSDCPVTMTFEDAGIVDVGRARDFQRDGDGVITAEITLFRGAEFEPEFVTMELAQTTIGPYDPERHPAELDPDPGEDGDPEQEYEVTPIITKADIMSVHLEEFHGER